MWQVITSYRNPRRAVFKITELYTLYDCRTVIYCIILYGTTLVYATNPGTTVLYEHEDTLLYCQHCIVLHGGFMKGGGHGNKKRRRGRRSGGGPRKSRSKSGTASPQESPTQPFPRPRAGRGKFRRIQPDNARGPVSELVVGEGRRRRNESQASAVRGGSSSRIVVEPTNSSRHHRRPARGATLVDRPAPCTSPAETETYVALRGEPCFSREV